MSRSIFIFLVFYYGCASTEETKSEQNYKTPEQVSIASTNSTLDSKKVEPIIPEIAYLQYIEREFSKTYWNDADQKVHFKEPTQACNAEWSGRVCFDSILDRVVKIETLCCSGTGIIAETFSAENSESWTAVVTSGHVIDDMIPPNNDYAIGRGPVLLTLKSKTRKRAVGACRHKVIDLGVVYYEEEKNLIWDEIDVSATPKLLTKMRFGEYKNETATMHDLELKHSDEYWLYFAGYSEPGYSGSGIFDDDGRLHGILTGKITWTIGAEQYLYRVYAIRFYNQLLLSEINNGRFATETFFCRRFLNN